MSTPALNSEPTSEAAATAGSPEGFALQDTDFQGSGFQSTECQGTAVATARTALAALKSSQRWQHAFGEMLIETRYDGTVWIDGQLIRDTSPNEKAGQG